MTRLINKGALLRWGALALLLPIAAAQTPVTRKPYIYWWQPGDLAYAWKPLVVDPPLVVTVDSTGQFHLSMPAPVPSLMFIPPAGDPIPLSSLSFNGDATVMYGNGAVQVGFNTAVLASRTAMQSGPASANSSGNPQTCAPQPLPDNPDAPLVPGADYISACSTQLTRLDKYQTLNWIVETVNVGPVSLSIDTLPAMPVLDRRGNPLAAGALAPGLYRIWNDGANWRVSEL